MARRRMMIAGVSAALLVGGSMWASVPAGAAEGFTLTPTSATVGTGFTLTASLPDGGTPCTTGAGVRVELLPPVGQGDQVITQNGEGDPSPGGIWTILLDVGGADIPMMGDYRVVVTCTGQDLTYGPEILTVGGPATTTSSSTTIDLTTVTAGGSPATAVAASPSFTG